MLAPSKNDGTDPLEFSLASDIVELVVLTADDVFLQTLRDAVGTSRRVWHVLSSDKVSDLLVAGQVGILVLDVQALHETAAVFVSQIKRQFPDLVVVVAGNRSAETLLASLISSGYVYRFIHKPMSPARARLFADAAVKRYDEQRHRASRAAIRSRTAPLARRRWSLAAGFGALAVITVACLILRTSHEQITVPRAADAPVVPTESTLLTRAAAALATNRLTPPATDNALELYLQALARNPSDPTARAGLTEVHERLLARAQNALLEERLDEAASDIQIARRSGVESGRIAFLNAQLARSRALLKAAAPAAPKSAAAGGSETGVEAELIEALSHAAERLQQGRLLEPDRDNARYYVQLATRIAPDSAAAAAMEESLAMALVTQTHAAIDHHDFARAAQLLDGARGVASQTNVDNLDHLLRAARDPAPPQSGGADAPTPPAAAIATPAASNAAADAVPEMVGADRLTLLKSVRPVYPVKAAAAGTEGWVELEFTVNSKGEVKDIAVRSSSPARVFDAAAVFALSQWRYRPVEMNAAPVEQRAHLRIRFTLGG